MTCRSFQALLLSGGAAGDPEAHAHLETCAPCAELAEAEELAVALEAARTEDLGDLSALRGRVDAALKAEVGPRAALRARSTPERAALALLAIAAVAGGTAAVLLRADFGVYPTDRMVLALLAFASTAVGGAVLALLPDHVPPRPVGLERFVLGTLLLLPVAFAVLPAAHASHPASALPEGAFAAATAACFAFGSGVAAAVVAVLRVLDRRTRWAGAFAVVAVGAGGAAGNLALQLHCPVTAVDHLVVGHALVGVVWAAVAWVALRLR